MELGFDLIDGRPINPSAKTYIKVLVCCLGRVASREVKNARQEGSFLTTCVSDAQGPANERVILDHLQA